MTLLSNWFIKRRGFVMSLGVSALGFAMILTPYAQYLISTLGWRATYLVFAGMAIFVVMMPNAILLQNRPEDKGMVPDGGDRNRKRSAENEKRVSRVIDRDWAGKEWSVKMSIRTYQFWGLILLHVFFGIYSYTLITHQVVYLVKDVGYSAMFGAAVFGCFGVFFAIGSGLGGYLSDRIGRETTFTFGSIGSLLSVILLLQISDTRLQWLSYLYAIFFGVSNGSLGGLFAPVVADFYAGKHFGAINGIMTMALVGGGSFGPWIGGIVRDVTGSFSIVFHSLLFIICATAIILWGVAPRKVRAVRAR
jgi:MFS family permease